MPKVNIYVPDDMLAWLRANEVKMSAEFQARIRELQGTSGGEPSTRPPRREIHYRKIVNNKVRPVPGAVCLGLIQDERDTFVVFME